MKLSSTVRHYLPVLLACIEHLHRERKHKIDVRTLQNGNNGQSLFNKILNLTYKQNANPTCDRFLKLRFYTVKEVRVRIQRIVLATPREKV